MMRAVLCLAFTAAACGAEFDSHVRETVMVPMRDGVRLASDVYRPARSGSAVEGRFPVLVTRTPYSRDGERAKGEFFARHGYVFVAQDCRGFFASEGRFEPMVREGADGFDTVEWSAKQPWSYGRVGMTGASYLALVQFAAMIERPPHLQAIYAPVGPADYYADSAWRGGVPSLGWPVWIANAAIARAPDAERKQLLEAAVREPASWLRDPPAARVPLFEGLPDYRAVYEDFYLHPRFDEYWRRPGYWPEGSVDRMKDVPAMLVSGWYDSFAEANLRLFRALRTKRRAPAHVIIGPWPHAYGKRECGDAVFPEDSALDERRLQLAWFDRWLKDARPEETWAPVRYFAMGGGPGFDGKHLAAGGAWRESDQWPPEGVRDTNLFLHANGRMDAQAPSQVGETSYRFDPSDPTPVAGGRYRNGCIVDVDRSELAKREDIVRFATAPMVEPLELAGPVSVELNVRTSARDADFVARLIDVWPDGYAAPVAEGQIRLSRRHGDGPREQIRPGRTYSVTFGLGATALVIPPGHRLRLDIMSGAFPAVEPNAGTGEDEWTANRRVSARQTIVTGGRRPSRVILPVAPAAK